MTTTTTPDVPLPDGAEPDNWWEDDPQDFRVIYGVSRGVDGHELIVQTSALQYRDGSINTSDDPPRVSLDVHYDSGLSSVQARELASVLIEAADEVDGWAGNATAVNRYPVDSATRTCCGGIGGHTQECPVEDRTTDQLGDTHRRIRNILDRFPATSWNLAESEIVLAALGQILRGRPEGERLGVAK